MIINKICFSGLDIEHISNPKLKNSYISVDKEANVMLKTPLVSNGYIQNLLTQKESWIRKKIENVKSNPPLVLNLDGINSQSSKEYLQSRISFFAHKMNLSYKELKFRKMRSRWGSCNSLGVITLNKKLIKTPDICIDYVVVHELAHLVHMNHSKKFHELIDSYIDESKKAKKILSQIVFK